MTLRQPIVSLMGHVDHGKTTLLDRIAGSARASREAGGITQHIGALEVPLAVLLKICQGLLRADQFTVPGLLFIDTPGHRSFVTMRRRGGALADLAVVVVDVGEGVMPQTREVLQILRHEKTPFVVAANKIDAVPGVKNLSPRPPLPTALAALPAEARKLLDERLYALSEGLYAQGFSAERYDRVSDYTRNVAMVPVSAKTGAGVPDLLAMMVGLSQRFLEKELELGERPGEATILERAEERGLGAVANIIVYQGKLATGDSVVVTGRDGPFATKIRGIYRPEALRPGRGTPSRRMASLPQVQAAAGVKISAPGIENALPGGLLKVVPDASRLQAVREELEAETHPIAAVSENGVWLKADTLGGLEALAFECQEAQLPVKGAEVGSVGKREVLLAGAVKDRKLRAILAFNVAVLPEAQEAVRSADVKILQGEVMYRILEDYQAWRADREAREEEDRRRTTTHPAKLEVLPGFVFRHSKPAIVGIKVMAGTLRPPCRLMDREGNDVGLLKGLQEEGKPVKEASEGKEVAASVDGAVVGRSFAEGDQLWVVLTEEGVRQLKAASLTPSEQGVLDEVLARHRARQPFWGT